MAAFIPEDVPVSMSAGTTVRFHRTFDDFPASSGWAYTFYANGATAKFNVPATVNDDGNSYDIVIPAVTTASIPAGRYQCCEVLTNSGSGEVVHPSGDALQLNIEANVATADVGAFLSHAERCLIVIEAALESRLTSDMQAYQIAGRSITKIAAKELLWFRAHYQSKIYQLQHPGRFGARVLVDFTEPDDFRTTLPPTWVDVTTLGAL